MEPVETAVALVGSRFPEAPSAFLGGTVLTAARTPTSDLDIVVVRADGSPTYRETVRYRGWPVELFVLTPAVYRLRVTREVAARRSPLLHLVGRGMILVDRDNVAAPLQTAARTLLAAGPPRPTTEEVEDRRYGLSDTLDDLIGVADPGELVFIADRALTATAQLAIILAGGWLGTGKWLGRQLGTADPALHVALLAAFRDAVAGDRTALVEIVSAVLDRAGGRLTEGYRRGPAADDDLG
ncbi:MAG: hypothetical protein QOI74_1901 [Micromonosporaceae bacterium]|jgi:hypothetical protein|nr:hypothetical protein [Micromonosporaceae bacterium]